VFHGILGKIQNFKSALEMIKILPLFVGLTIRIFRRNEGWWAMIYRVGIVGAGLMGKKRAATLLKFSDCKLIATADVDYVAAWDLAQEFGGEVMRSYEELVARHDIDIVIVATPNKYLMSICISALNHGKHVLCEKPFGCNVAESNAIVQASIYNKRILRVGFNHRYHPAIFLAKRLLVRGSTIGNISFIRARYGHGGRLGMEKEWRFNLGIAGGGELLDQGVHLIDLARWLSYDSRHSFGDVFGAIDRKFWNSDVEDNAFFILRSDYVTASFHVSASNWKNIFSFEIFGDAGFLVIDGLGGSYGEETLTFGKRRKKFGVPIVRTFRFNEDTSFENEWRDFLNALRGETSFMADGEDGIEVQKIVEAIYRSSRLKKVVSLE
jgi:predicted dehydrogenase